MLALLNRFAQIFGRLPFTHRVDVQAVKRALQAVEGLPLPDVESLLIEQGHVLVTLQIDPAQAAMLQDVATRAEAGLRGLRGVQSARVILTAERAPQPAVSPVAAASPVGHTAIHLKGAASQTERPLVPHVRHIIAVASGKGGVGKSTVAVNLAVTLATLGQRVGLLDADIYGPSIPTMLGIAGQKPEQRTGPDGTDMLVPLAAHGIGVMSMGSLVGGDAAMIWRGPMVQSAIVQMLRDVDWGELDILVLDMPPGTGDAQLTVAQKVPLKGAIIVSTPQDIAWLDATKGIGMFRKVGVPILGIVENMAQFCCPHCRTVTPLFGPNHGAARAAQLDAPWLGDIPLDPALQQGGDQGMPLAVAAPGHPVADSFRSIARAVIDHLG